MIVRILMSRWMYRMTRWVLAAVFLYSGIGKLSDPGSFAVIIDAYGLIPETWVMPAAVFLPLIEVIAAVGLVFDARLSLETLTVLLLLFMAVLGYGIHLGLDIDCGCFGAGDPEYRAFSGLRAALYRDAAMLAAMLCLYARRICRKEKKHTMPYMAEIV